jgi:hypothetical protein
LLLLLLLSLLLLSLLLLLLLQREKTEMEDLFSTAAASGVLCLGACWNSLMQS